ncbi:hypothetical protein EDD64_12711 [Effusibacillus lacus]|nr:hypothetical protein EDD64_12711 [Effusibacillus lacus]
MLKVTDEAVDKLKEMFDPQQKMVRLYIAGVG